MVSKHEALLRRLSLDPEPEELEAGGQSSFGSPKKSPLLRFDFVEICGGAAKVS